MTEKTSHRQILRSSSIIGGASLINILIGLLRIKVVAVLLGPAGVGLVGILLNLMSTVATIAALGFGTVGTRQIAEAVGREDQPTIDTARRALFWGTLFLAVVGGILFWSLRHVLADKVLADPGMASTVGWLAVGVALTVVAGSQGALLTGMRRIGDFARVQVCTAVISTVLGLAAIWSLGEAGLLLYIVAGPLAAFVSSKYYIARLPKIQSPPVPFVLLAEQWKTMAQLGMAFMLAGLVGMLGQLAVRTMVQHQLGADSLGHFQAAWMISMTYLGFVLGAMGTDYYPRLTAVIHDHAAVNRLVNEQTEVALLLAGPVLLGMLALAPWVVRLLYSAEFDAATDVLRWQILGDVLKIASWPLGFVILAAGAGRTFMLSESVAMTVFVVVTWLVLPWLGIQATGISFLIMYLVYLPLVFWLAKRRTGFAWSRAAGWNAGLLLCAAVLTAGCGAWDEWLGFFGGFLLAGLSVLIALLRLAYMSGLGGPVGRVAERVRYYIFKLGFFDD